MNRIFAALLVAGLFLARTGDGAAAGSFTTPPTIDAQAPLIIEGPSVVSVTDTTAIIRWHTNEIGDSRVEYGLGSPTESAVDGNRVTDHLVTLTKLAPDTTYAYRVQSTDPSANTASSAVFGFRTTTSPDSVAPVLSVLAVSEVSAGTARIAWSSSEPVTWVLQYGASAAPLWQQIAGEAPGVAGARLLTNLAAGSSYTVQMVAWDVAGNEARSAALSFTTIPAAPGPVQAATSTGSVTFSWPLVPGATGYTVYCARQSGVTAANYATLPEGHLATTSTEVLTHLMAAGEWHAVVTASNASGESLASQEIAFTIPSVQDSAAPTVPQGLAATALGATSIALVWNAATDDVGVQRYEVYREGTPNPVATPGGTAYTDVGLIAGTLYSYTVRACDASGNCSAPSAPATATTQGASPTVGYAPNLATGWNLLGNSLEIVLDVALTFGNSDAPVDGVTASVYSIWKWNPAAQRWAFYSPMLSASNNVSYAENSGYELLAFIRPGEGYWVNAASPIALPRQSGAPVGLAPGTFAALPSGWNLLAFHAEVPPSPSSFNRSVSGEQAVQVPQSFWSLWQWDTARERWYFYSPLLEAQGGLAGVKAYAESNNYLDFETVYEGASGPKRLEAGSGFWVNR